MRLFGPKYANPKQRNSCQLSVESFKAYLADLHRDVLKLQYRYFTNDAETMTLQQLAAYVSGLAQPRQLTKLNRRLGKVPSDARITVTLDDFVGLHTAMKGYQVRRAALSWLWLWSWSSGGRRAMLLWCWQRRVRTRHADAPEVLHQL